MVRIIRNVGGIEGLHLATDCFTEEVEMRIFTSIDESGYQSGERTGQSTGLDSWPYDWPDDYIKLTNLVSDCGLLPDYVPPDYCLRLMYPPKAGFQLHHDSQYRWGEVIVGVNLGQEGEMMFTPDKAEDAFGHAAVTSEFASKAAGVGKSMRVKLPRRSIYVMSGKSRYVYKHGIMQQKPSQAPPSWNKLNMRKSLTFRSNKVFSDMYLERQVQEAAEANNETTMRRWQSRKDAQDKYKPKLSKAEVADERQKATVLLNRMDSDMMDSDSDSNIIPIPSQLRFARSEVTFDLPPGVATQQQQQKRVIHRNSNGGFGAFGIDGSGVGGGGIVAAGAAPFAFAAFQGEGRQLGSSTSIVGGEDGDMQMAINASLRSLAEERASRSEKKRKSQRSLSYKDASESCEEASPKKRSEQEGATGTGTFGGVIDLVGRDDYAASPKKRSEEGAAGTSTFGGVIDLVGEDDDDDDEEEDMKRRYRHS